MVSMNLLNMTNITRTSAAGLTYGLEFLWGSLDITEKSAIAGRENAINKGFNLRLSMISTGAKAKYT